MGEKDGGMVDWIKAAQKAGALKPGDANAHANRGAVLAALRRYGEAMAAAYAAYRTVRESGEPDAASSARPPAKIGVIVESEPHDKKRLLPNAANASVIASTAHTW